MPQAGGDPAQLPAEGEEPDPIPLGVRSGGDRGEGPHRPVERGGPVVAGLAERVEEQDDVGAALRPAVVHEQLAGRTAGRHPPVDGTGAVAGGEGTDVGELDPIAPGAAGVVPHPTLQLGRRHGPTKGLR